MQIERNILTELVAWKTSPRRKPLLLKGVRQCGKSWVLERFGHAYFNNVVIFNFEKNPDLMAYFEGSYDPRRLLTDLSASCGQRILPQETLIVFDEIQLCPRALNSLKYFCEEAPQYAIASAGSLLGVSLAAQEGVPVGKVDIREMHPCSFGEYLRAIAPMIAAYLGELPLTPVPAPIAAKLETHFREYLTVGGMPEALSAFMETHDILEADRVLDSILEMVEVDFSKHVPPKDLPKVRQIWNSIPVQFAKENRRFFYGEVRSGARAKDLEDAMQWLQDAALVCKVQLAEVPEMPLAASVDRKVFKLYPADVGVLRKLAKLSPSTFLNSGDVFSDFRGRLAENYVLQQLNAVGISPVCYWFSPKGKAEVDFLIQDQDGIIPLEVKSALNLKAKSLKVYRDQFRPALAIRVSQSNLRLDDGLLNLPLYLMGELPRLMKLAKQAENG